MSSTTTKVTAIDVIVELKETSQALTYTAFNTYTKGHLYCIYTLDNDVHKFPLSNIWRIVETYK